MGLNRPCTPAMFTVRNPELCMHLMLGTLRLLTLPSGHISVTINQTNPILQITNLSKAYGAFDALKSLNLSVIPGEVYALLGPNGAGKTTAIKLLMGMLVPSSGQANIGGYDCFTQRKEVMTLVGYQPDEPTFQDHLTGWDLIRFSGDLRGMRPQDTVDLATPLAERLDLYKDLNEYATNYSKGMRKKLAAILAMLHSPKILLLDEPTNGLDPYATRDFHELIQEYAQAGTAVFLSTHLLDQAQRCCSRVGIINKGVLAAEGDLESLRSHANQNLEEIFFSVTSDPHPHQEDSQSEE
ncbi:MAG: ABC transporter ATP-binding protein [Planctomycetes bacterium]|nr:ABC transporter ATP-binding protein [Planctomycetota bacterium]